MAKSKKAVASFQARQGDIFFKSVAAVPKGLKPYKNNILAYGEVTGHSHKIMTPAIADMESFVDENGDIYVMSPLDEIKVGHDEHTEITIPANTWVCVSRQREYDPLAANRERLVAD
jgi:hypothetical protein